MGRRNRSRLWTRSSQNERFFRKMNMSEKYEVFISFKSTDASGRPTRDRRIAREIHDFLVARGIPTFYSERSLEDHGVSEFKKFLDKALDDTKVLVIVGTSRENMESQFVRYEWDSFFNDIMSGLKPGGRVFTYIDGIQVASLPRTLRQTQVIVHGLGSMERLHTFVAHALDRMVVPQESLEQAKENADVVAGKRASFKIVRRGFLVRHVTPALLFTLVVLIILLFGYPGFLRTGTEEPERQALNYYQTGQFDQALVASKALMQMSPSLCVPYLIQGNIFLRKGRLEEAGAAFQKAWQTDRGTVLQKAEAMIGLGRVASLRKNRDKALECYRKATEMAPGSKLGYLSQALLLEDKGDYGGALSLFEKTYAMEPQDSSVAGMANETRKRVAIKDDHGKQERINTLVKELMESMTSPPRAFPWDGWTSPPLTLWILDFETQGYSVQEGEERLLAAGISEQLLQKSRVQLVERQLLERLLEELKLGTSNLTDRTTALAVGKLLAARLMLIGRIVYSEPQTQISLRLIETETGRISAAMNQAFGSLVPVSALSDKLSSSLIDKLSALYPLRGKISEVKDGSISINIGLNVGVVVGQKFESVDEKVVFEVTSVQPESCLAKAIGGEQLPQKEMRVEVLAKRP